MVHIKAHFFIINDMETDSMKDIMEKHMKVNGQEAKNIEMDYGSTMKDRATKDNGNSENLLAKGSLN